MRAQRTSGNLYNTIKFCFREIIRNVVEHSECDEFMLCGQYWPKSNTVDVCVYDCGIGLAQSLSKNPRFPNLDNDLKAIRLALLPSISGKKFYGVGQDVREPDNDGAWGNSGFGLYMTSQLTRQSGLFAIATRNSSLVLQGSDKSRGRFGEPGTFIGLSLNVGQLLRLEPALEEIARRGEDFANRHVTRGAEISASAASKILNI